MFEVKWYEKANIEGPIIFRILKKLSLLLKDVYVPSESFIDDQSVNSRTLMFIRQILKSLFNVSWTHFFYSCCSQKPHLYRYMLTYFKNFPGNTRILIAGNFVNMNQTLPKTTHNKPEIVSLLEPNRLNSYLYDQKLNSSISKNKQEIIEIKTEKWQVPEPESNGKRKMNYFFNFIFLRRFVFVQKYDMRNLQKIINKKFKKFKNKNHKIF